MATASLHARGNGPTVRQVLPRLLLAGLLAAFAGAAGPVTEEEGLPNNPFWSPYGLARDREYISYLEALDLSSTVKSQLWDHLTRKYEAQARLDAEAEAELGEVYADEVDLLVITYDRDSEHWQRLNDRRAATEKELRGLLTEDQVETHRRFQEVKEVERAERKLRHEIEDMELDLTPRQFEVLKEIFRQKPVLFQEPPGHRGASGYSMEYVQARERWRFEQEQAYLAENILPVLDEAQARRFRTWQEVQRIELQESLEAYRNNQVLLGHRFPEKKRRVKILVPAPFEPSEEKEATLLECRNNRLFLIPMDEINRLTTQKLKTVARDVRGDTRGMKNDLEEAVVESGAYRVDFTYALLGQFLLLPRPEVPGYALDGEDPAVAKKWLEEILAGLDPDREMLTFLVRDDSFEVFQQARALAAHRDLEVAYELLSPAEPIKFGLGGSPETRNRQLMSDAAGGNSPVDDHKKPQYIDVHEDHLVMYPGETILSAAEMEDEGNALEKLLDAVEAERDQRYIALLIRPRSSAVARRLKKMIAARGIEMKQELYEDGRPVTLPIGL